MKKTLLSLVATAVFATGSVVYAEPLIPVVQPKIIETKLEGHTNEKPLFGGPAKAEEIDPNSVSIVVNNVPIFFQKESDQPFIDKQGRTQVPVRFVSEALGKKVEWDGDTQTVTINGKIRLRINSSVVEVEGKSIHMDTIAQLREKRTFVPVRFVSEALGQKVTWEEHSRTVLIETPQGAKK